jgi:indolepyruvate ferredoxin oxidoreductase beta subunit
MSDVRAYSVLICALGGEGGGVLAGWLTRAAREAGATVSRTSIPGVAQRTGATTYYLEFALAGDGATPVLSLYPSPGNVDVVVATELLEAGRALKRGFVTPDRTTLIAATHRVYTIAERTAMGDERFEQQRLLEAARRLACRAVLLDVLKAAGDGALNATLLGAIAASDALPLPVEAYRAAIRAEGKSVEANLRAFEAGLHLVTERDAATVQPLAEAAAQSRFSFLPSDARAIAAEGVRRLTQYQSAAYAEDYLQRLYRLRSALPEGCDALIAETARHLALLMSYEDAIRVADLKTQPDRMARVRAEVRAKLGEPLIVTEYLKPGIEEVSALLPAGIARRLQAWAARRGLIEKWSVGLRVRSTSVSGYVLLRVLAGMRRVRPRTLQFAQTHELIEQWLETVRRTAALDIALAEQVVESARLIKGYGDTRRRGLTNYRRLMDEVTQPALARQIPAAKAVDLLRRGCAAALADDTGTKLDELLVGAQLTTRAA